MEFTVKKLSEIAGVSVRTLRYYDEIGLLKPYRINSSGYRIYSQREVDLLQQILFYKELDMKLEEIQNIILNPNFDVDSALIEHHKKLISKREQLNKLILTVEKTISHNKGEVKMSNSEKFEAFKKEKLSENEAKYGNEIREKYGKSTIEKSNKMYMNMSEEDFGKMKEIENRMFENLKKLIKSEDLNSNEAINVYEYHKEWLSFTWPSYSKEAHVGLASMYIADERFAKYYNDRTGEKSTKMLHDAIVKYAK